jgi:hypothetical protein
MPDDGASSLSLGSELAKTERVTRHESETPDWHIARLSKPSKLMW